VAAIAGLLLVAGAFLVALFTQHNVSIFALTPLTPSGVTVPALDIIPTEKVYAFHVTIYTIWATIALSLPAFCLVWFVRGSQMAGRYWLAFWTVGLIAMLIHQFLAMGILFEWNWQHILVETVRVTIPIPDLVLTIWWIFDVLLGWILLHSRGFFLHAQRLLLHIALIVIFLIGFIREGEILLSKFIGVVSAVLIIAAIAVRIFQNRTS